MRGNSCNPFNPLNSCNLFASFSSYSYDSPATYRSVTYCRDIEKRIRTGNTWPP